MLAALRRGFGSGARRLRSGAAAVLAILAILLSGSFALAKDGGGALQTVEMFTSQGCSSCPPADRLAGKLKGRDNLLVLSFNVDYWDRLGWKDTLASAAGTNRQRMYARQRGDRRVYTPQAVVNGRAHEVGSNRESIQRQLISQLGSVLAVRSSWQGEDLHLSVADDGGTDLRGLRLVAVRYVPEVTVSIGAGENGGRSVTYHNVVRDFQQVGTWGGGDSVVLAGFGGRLSASEETAILLQRGEFGPIVGAVKLT